MIIIVLPRWRRQASGKVDFGFPSSRFPSPGSVGTGWRDARVRKPERPRPARRLPPRLQPQGPGRPRRGAAPPPLRPAGCGRGGRQRCQRGNRRGPRETEVVLGAAGTSPDASAMDTSLEKVGTEGSGRRCGPGSPPLGRLFPVGKGSGLKSLSGGGVRPGPGHVTGGVAEGGGPGGVGTGLGFAEARLGAGPEPALAPWDDRSNRRGPQKRTGRNHSCHGAHCKATVLSKLGDKL